jgi:hypothetical protein
VKIQWEPDDIRTGRRSRKPGCHETWVIGYEVIDERDRLCVISILDGMVARSRMSAAEVARYLTEAGHHPVELLETKQES